MPRTAFGLNKGLKTEFFATPDWTGRPVAVDHRAARAGRLGECQARARNRHPRLFGSLVGHARRSRRRRTMSSTLEPADSFPYSPVENYRFILDGKVISEGSLRAGRDPSAMGNFKAGTGRFAHRAAGR